MRPDLTVRLSGVQGYISVGSDDDEEKRLIWLTIDDSETPSIGVDPDDLRAAISFVLSEPTPAQPVMRDAASGGKQGP